MDKLFNQLVFKANVIEPEPTITLDIKIGYDNIPDGQDFAFLRKILLDSELEVIDWGQSDPLDQTTTS